VPSAKRRSNFLAISIEIGDPLASPLSRNEAFRDELADYNTRYDVSVSLADSCGVRIAPMRTRRQSCLLISTRMFREIGMKLLVCRDDDGTARDPLAMFSISPLYFHLISVRISNRHYLDFSLILPSPRKLRNFFKKKTFSLWREAR
jgi:hypothetical protein